MRHSKYNKDLILGVGWNKHWSLLFPPPIPIPSVSKSLLPGDKQIKKKHMFDDLLCFLIIVNNSIIKIMSKVAVVVRRPSVVVVVVVVRLPRNPQKGE